MKERVFSGIFIAIAIILALFLIKSEDPKSAFGNFPFKLGLDLAGGTELIYKADVSKVPKDDVASAMESLKEVIERRINVFGVSEPVVRVEESSVVSGDKEHRLAVELPGVTDIQKAISLIGKTPVLEFKLLKKDAVLPENATSTQEIQSLFEDTGLTGRYLQNAKLEFAQTGTNALGGEPLVSIQFNAEGAELFEKITSENIDRVMAIFLDGEIISAPVIRQGISGGQAQISGGFVGAEGAREAKELAGNLRLGALPVPIELQRTQTIGATLGKVALDSGVTAGIWGFIIISLFLVLWYRLPGFLAAIGLLVYVLISLTLFKLIPVTLTAAGLAGFIITLGIAIDANILIFERMKEEIKNGKSVHDAMSEGFKRAWPAIRDSNISGLITSAVLFWLGTSGVKGFALTYGLGVFVSMFTALVVTRTFLLAVSGEWMNQKKELFKSGIK